ncbi:MULTISPECIES: bifunctional aminoglycoside phosphotransferase/ATP-binding protein [Filomicrobium]|uniref:Aminoglycoside phosphotransferase domain-containing protein n=1 Tax=Filomicrobium insigne TaxID=418854 RepID=A0A1H0G704_9HYPH|nr:MULTISPECIES: bifunctional aminoglycoside phosphotransferase/ATP-binding protein [Filomicrobium]MCV0369996.1 AAA family ATPase [Filomicrobium sp.]SDO02630.1 hypothetical protein SAMN04488061_0074 [Filomicrobium insigne]
MASTVPEANGAQADVIAFLENPANYAPAPEGVDRIDTHGAIVFLAGDYAYKMKRAVRLPYLDFSTLDQRLRACNREFELNTRIAPELYLRVCPILRQPDGMLSWQGAGEIVEYVLIMRRFEQSQLLDEMAIAGKLDEKLMVPLAHHIVDTHGSATVHKDVDPAKSFETILEHVTAALTRDISPIPVDDVAAYRAAASAALRETTPLMRERARQGFVRRCHGDMHLRNIVLLESGPTLFDALEFDETLATIDVLYGLAFLLMDLYRRGMRRHACQLFNQYLQDQSGIRHLEGLALLPFFLSCRAAIRAMVGLDRKANVSQDRTAAIDDDVRQYFAFSRQFLTPPRARLIVVGGLSGTGKTTVARMLAPDIEPVPGALHLRSDVERKLMYEWDPEEPLPESAYAEKVTAHVYQRLGDKAECALRAGHSVIVDAVFATESERRDIEARARKADAEFLGLWLTAPADVLYARVSAREGDASDADVQVVHQQLSYDIGVVDWQHIDVDAGPDEVRLRAAKIIGLPQHN